MDTATKFYNASGQLTTGTGKIDSPIRYAGYQYDNETGLYYLNARYYDADIARFISEDTYRGDPKDPLSLNLYTYVNNEPMMYDDPTGHMPKWLKKAAKVTFKVAKFAVLDDIMTLANPKATLGQKILAGVSLLPVGKIIKVAQVAIKVTKTVKATNAVSKNVSLVRLSSSKSGPTMASRVSTKKQSSVTSSNKGKGSFQLKKNKDDGEAYERQELSNMQYSHSAKLDNK
ncbi:RHS repeat-associated core domain-containing protein [Paenibacillus sp. GCM10027627]|uniref:RHS repeat-associated core domain-containing protein n=1 Tax=Paenibacillus sp. GCM10027627 TaxID=3273412 RepID=UPI00363BCFF5